MLPFIFPLSFLVSLRHLFPSLIYKQLSRKATLMFQDVLLFERFQRTLPNSFLFSFKSTYKFSCPNLQVRKKSYCPLTSPVMAIRFFPHLSATNQRASWAENKLSHIIYPCIDLPADALVECLLEMSSLGLTEDFVLWVLLTTFLFVASLSKNELANSESIRALETLSPKMD